MVAGRPRPKVTIIARATMLQQVLIYFSPKFTQFKFSDREVILQQILIYFSPKFTQFKFSTRKVILQQIWIYFSPKSM